ncbi:glycerol dehydrogenase [Oceanivirga salmonicida]|uniref:glycerol dehydrogenase n=1 Tax=Oceanivirga salmonicida TaxID=1769291 RepID=UPI0012E1E8A9|nr:glycerol dehydrogenase [Oceanivirga salmonicida]
MARIICSPSKYIQGSGEIKKLKSYSDLLSKTGVYVLVDKFVYDNYKELIEYSFRDDLSKCHLEVFTGNSTKQEVDRNIKILKEKSFDTVIAIGGGKTIDIGKAISYYANLPMIVVPTVVSTDAPCSALSVLYTENGEFDKYLYLNSNPNIVLVDTQIIVKAPTRLLVAGMGDALSTYYEAMACYNSGVTIAVGGKTSNTALALAKLCLDTLMTDGCKAKISSENGIVDEAFENIVEANTYLSGVGFESGGEAAGHAIHNGLTILQETNNKLHGEKVAFGTITQLIMENRSLDEIQKVIDFCKNVGLPTNFKDLGIENVSHDRLMEVAKASCAENETIHNMPFKVNPEMVFDAMIKANELGSK